MKDESWAAGLPKPTGRDCPDHPTYPLVHKPGEGDWCRRGQHFVPIPPPPESRSVQRRKAVQQGQEPPEFDHDR